jgi:hypothetical protein
MIHVWQNLGSYTGTSLNLGLFNVCNVARELVDHEVYLGLNKTLEMEIVKTDSRHKFILTCEPQDPITVCSLPDCREVPTP